MLVEFLVQSHQLFKQAHLIKDRDLLDMPDPGVAPGGPVGGDTAGPSAAIASGLFAASAPREHTAQRNPAVGEHRGAGVTQTT
jgi:hypothetical protein